mgnify:CR=1 FL=1
MHQENTVYVAAAKILDKGYVRLAKELPKSSKLTIIALEGFNWKQAIPKNITCIDFRLGLREISALIATDMLTHKYNRMCSFHKSVEEKDFIDNTLIPNVKSLFWISLMTTMTFAPRYVINSVENLKYIATSPSVGSFYSKAPNIPAIIVGAGPSLNKNIKTLKTLQDKALIISAGSAAGALKKYKITPDITCASDAGEYDDLDKALDKKSILMASFELLPKVSKLHKGRRAYFYSRDEWTLSWAKQYIPTPTYLQQNISVSTAAFNLAMMMGCNPIIFVGQDLAFDNDTHHADGVVAADYQKRKDREIDVEGYYGDTVKTVNELKDVGMYLGSAKLIRPYVKMMNCTEGGAKIPNFEQCPLAEAGLDKDIDKSFLDTIYEKFQVPVEPERFKNFIRKNIEKLQEMKNKLEELPTLTSAEWLRYCKSLEYNNVFQIVKQVVSGHNLYIFFQTIDKADQEILDTEANNTKQLLINTIGKVIEEFEKMCHD